MNTLRNPRYLAVLGAMLLTAVVAAAFVLLSGRDDESEPGAVASATPEPATPAITPTLRAGANPFAAFKLEESEGELQFASGGVEQIPADKIGVWFLDIAKGQVEGWIDLLIPSEPYAFSGDNRLTVFRRREQVFQGGVIYPAGFALADRSTRKVYRWQGDAQPVLSDATFNGSRLAAVEGRILLRIPVADSEDWFAVVDLDAQGRVLTTFRAEGTFGLLSDDGTWAVIFGDGLSLVELTTGVIQRAVASPDRRIDAEGQLRIQNNLKGDGFLLTISPVKAGYDAAWSHYTWEGRLLAEGDGGSQIYPSPNGEMLGVFEPLTAEQPPASVLNVVDSRTGNDLFRVVGVVTSLGYTTGNRWLADASGVVVSDPSLNLSLAMRDGSLRPYVGMPSPDSPNLFAVGSSVDGGPSVRDGSGNVLASISPTGGSRSFVPPWGDVGTEIRFITPHGGHGGLGNARSLVQPYVEQAPYGGPPALQLSATAAGAALFGAPAGSQVVGRLPAPLRITVQQAEALRLEPGQAGYEEHCKLLLLLTGQPALSECRGALWGVWARVTTGGAQEGWLLVQVSPEGE